MGIAIEKKCRKGAYQLAPGAFWKRVANVSASAQSPKRMIQNKGRSGGRLYGSKSCPRKRFRLNQAAGNSSRPTASKELAVRMGARGEGLVAGNIPTLATPKIRNTVAAIMASAVPPRLNMSKRMERKSGLRCCDSIYFSSMVTLMILSPGGR